MKALLQPEITPTQQPFTLSQQRVGHIQTKTTNNFFSTAMAEDLKEKHTFKNQDLNTNPITQDNVDIKNRFCFKETNYKGPDSVNGVMKGTSAVPQWKSSQRCLAS